MHKVVAITGATGFIGKRLVNTLTEAGWRVKAITRKKKADTPAVTWLHGDLANQSILNELVSGVSAVIHCAGAVRGASFEAFAYTNISGTEHLLQAITQQQKPPRVLVISSLAARESQLSWYAQSKYLAEQSVINHRPALDWTIFRPTAVYGPGDKELRPLFQITRKGFLPVIGKLHNRFGLIHVDDLIAAMHVWLARTVPCPGIFEIDDGTPGGYSFQSLADLLQEIWNRPVRCIAVPCFLIQNIAVINLQLAKILGYSPMLTPEKVKELHHPDWVCDNAPLMQALPDWQPRIRLHDAIPQIV